MHVHLVARGADFPAEYAGMNVGRLQADVAAGARAPADASAPRSTRCCDGPLGAVSVLVRPS